MKNIIAAACLLVTAATPTAFGQLTLTGPDSTNVPCGTAVTLTTSVEETNGLAVIVTWWLNGIAVETNAVPAATPPVVTDVSLVGVLPPGTNLVDVVAENSDGLMVTNSAVVMETDTNPPVIVSAAPSKTTLWPPNHKLVKINVTAETTDDCGEVTWKIVKVRSNEPRNGEGDGNTVRGRQFGALSEQLLLLDAAVIDVGSSNVEDFVRLMRQYEGSHEDVDLFIVPAVKESKQIRDTIATIQALAAMGVPANRVRVVFNKVETDETLEDAFYPLLAYHDDTQAFALRPSF